MKDTTIMNALNAAAIDLPLTPSIEPTDLDVSIYMDELAGLDLSKAQKVELLETLKSIMTMMVDLGIRMDVCGYLAPEFAGEAAEPSLMDVESPPATAMEAPSLDGEQE